MKKYNMLIIMFLFGYLVLAFMVLKLWHKDTKDSKEYRIEINRVLVHEISENTIKDLNEQSYQFITDIQYLSENEPDIDKIKKFYEDGNNIYFIIKPVYKENNLSGYVRFDYKKNDKCIRSLFIIEGMLLFIFILLLFLLLYIKNNIISPFIELSNMPYELAKGHLQRESYESKNKFFGKFLWGIGMLRDTLKDSRNSTLQLEKEKKLLLLSLSHDIKTPLNAIKLYVKAIEQHLYKREEEENIIKHIGEKALEIERFIGQIVKSSSEDILHIEIRQGEFYLKDLMDKISLTYKTKCQLMMTEFLIETYENRLFSGDIERMVEVFENILENALKYGDGKRIQISFYEEDYHQLIRVYNTGEPISDYEFIHLYDSFFRGNNINGKEGNGLGLYICKQIMTKMGGDIFTEIESDGISFVVVLPNT